MDGSLVSFRAQYMDSLESTFELGSIIRQVLGEVTILLWACLLLWEG